MVGQSIGQKSRNHITRPAPGELRVTQLGEGGFPCAASLASGMHSEVTLEPRFL
jgi:hypothetical protein